MEGIIHIRIDDRLIHGQVAVFWTRRLNANRIMVIDDAVAVDEMRKATLRMVAPAGVNTSILPVEKAAANILSDRYKGQRVLVVVNSPLVIERLMKLGLDIKELNVGNLSKRDGTEQIKKSISVTEEEKECFKRLMDAGVTLTANMTPEEHGNYLKDYLR